MPAPYRRRYALLLIPFVVYCVYHYFLLINITPLPDHNEKSITVTGVGECETVAPFTRSQEIQPLGEQSCIAMGKEKFALLEQLFNGSIKHSDFSGLGMQVTMENLVIENVRFNQADLRGTIFRNVTFINCDFTDAIFYFTTLEQVSFHKSILNGTKFIGINDGKEQLPKFDRVNFHHTIGLSDEIEKIKKAHSRKFLLFCTAWATLLLFFVASINRFLCLDSANKGYWYFKKSYQLLLLQIAWIHLNYLLILYNQESDISYAVGTFGLVSSLLLLIAGFIHALIHSIPRQIIPGNATQRKAKLLYHITRLASLVVFVVGHAYAIS